MQKTVTISRVCACLLLASLPAVCEGEGRPVERVPEAANDAPPARKISPAMRAALEKLVMPGVRINLDQWCVDVDSRVCLKEGLLELIACTKDTKEHESILMIEAKPSHVHTALLLLGAKPGSPAMQRMTESDPPRFISTPPHGGLVGVYLLFKDAAGVEKEHPISDFLLPADDDGGTGGGPQTEKKRGFPTHEFLFAGSILAGDGKGPRRYLCDESGNVISLSTFGDEVLCLPGFHEQANGALIWQVNGEKLPELDSRIILRLRPKEQRPAAPPPAPVD